MMKVRAVRSLYRILSFGCVSLLAVLAGCGVSVNGNGNPTTGPTVTIASSASSINAGGSATLTVVAANATSVKITGSDGSSYNLGVTGGTQSVSPAATTTYTATAIGGGTSITAQTTITVGAQGPSGPPTVSIAANPTSINAGNSSTLTIAATNATQVTVAGSDGTSYTLSPTGGTQVVKPAATTTYTATAAGAGGANVTAQTTVTVTPAVANAPTVTIAANPTSINPGGSSTLTVVATNATQVIVTGSDGSSYTLQPNGGTQAVSPAVTTTYTATASGAGANATQTAVVTVQPPQAAPTVTIAAAPTSITAGSPSTLTVVATNATQVIVTGTDGSTNTLSNTGGTLAVSPATTTTYTATASGTGTPATAAVTVTVVPAPPPATPTVTIAANPNPISAGQSSTLAVSATNANQVTVTGSDGSSYTLAPTGGLQTVSPASTTTYNVTASGAAGSTAAQASVILTVNQPPTTTVSITASPSSISSGGTSTLTVTATNATRVTIAGSDNSSYTLPPAGGTQAVTPTATTTYTATATGSGNPVTATATVTVTPPGSVQSIDHVIFMLQENHSFDNYFGMLNPYRQKLGLSQTVDGIDDKLATITNQDDEGNTYHLFKFGTTCIDDESSAWLESYGDVSRFNFTPSRPIALDGFVHTAEGFAKSCAASGTCSGSFTDLAGQRAMGYYDESFLNYYYYMATQFAVSNRWFSPVSSKSIPNRIATFTGGTTIGLVFDPGNDDKLAQLNIPNIFQELDQAKVSWKIYYTVTQGSCLSEDDCGGGSAAYPATTFSALSYSFRYIYENPTHAACTGTTQPSSVVGDSTNSFCIDPNRIAPIANYYTDLTNGTLPSFSFIESGSGVNDEHPGSGQSILTGQVEVAKVVNAFTASPEWKNSVFFFSYDEGGGPYDHVPPVPGHSNDNTDTTLAGIPVLSSSNIAVNADSDFPCVPTTPPATLNPNCDLRAGDPGAASSDAPAQQGFAAQLGFRLPNIIISPFTIPHYVGNKPMDHTAVIKFVESRFINSSAHLTPRDAAQPDLLDFFDFTNIPNAAPPTPPAPVTPATLGHDPCTPTTLQ